MARFDFDKARRNLRSTVGQLYKLWKENPSSVEREGTPTKKEITSIERGLCADFYEHVAISKGLSVGQDVSLQDIALVRRILGAIQPLEDHFIADPHRRAWNPSCVEHSMQVGVLARVLAEQLGLDANKIEVMGLVHDIGRYASHHPWIHGLAGMDLLKLLGFCEEYTIIPYSHLEAGASLLGATPENFEEMLNTPEIQDEVNRISIQEIVIALADMAKKGIEKPKGSGNFVNTFANPLEGVFVSGLRRLTDEQKQVVQHINPLDIKGTEQLLQVFRINGNMGMYLGLCWFFMKRLMKEGVVFESNDGVIARAQEIYDKTKA